MARATLFWAGLGAIALGLAASAYLVLGPQPVPVPARVPGSGTQPEAATEPPASREMTADERALEQELPYLEALTE
ncbi:MAG: hypothetical protein ACFBRM_02380 [Pikeienuella sp.]